MSGNPLDIRWHLRQPRAVLLAAAGLFAAVAAVRVSVGADATDAVLVLLAVPIALVALTLGHRAGIITGVLATALFVAWVEVERADVTPVGYLSRLTTFLVLGALVGYGVEHIRRQGELAERAAAALAESDEQFRLLVQGVGEYAIYMLDPDGRVASWNSGAEAIKGYTAEEIIGEPFDRFYTTEDREKGVPGANLREARRAGHFAEEGRRLRKDGSVFWASVTISPLFDADGTLRGFAKVVRDITERKDADQRLHRSQAQLAAAERVAGMGSWEWEIAANRVAWSDELYRIFGLESGQFAGSYEAFLDRVHPDDREFVERQVEAAVRAGAPVRYEFRLVRPDGSTRTMENRVELIRDESGAPSRLVGTALDVTDVRDAERAFRHAEERFNYWFEGPPVGMALVSMAPEERGSILQANPALCEITGRRDHELLGVSLGELLPIAREAEATLDDLLNGETDRYTGDHLLVRSTGEEINVKVHGWVMGEPQSDRRYSIIQIQEFASSTGDGQASAQPLTPREQEVLRLVADGCSGPDIAAQLHLSPETVKDHLRSLYQKLGVRERAAAVAQGMRAGLID